MKLGVNCGEKGWGGRARKNKRLVADADMG